MIERKRVKRCLNIELEMSSQSQCALGNRFDRNIFFLLLFWLCCALNYAFCPFDFLVSHNSTRSFSLTEISVRDAFCNVNLCLG